MPFVADAAPSGRFVPDQSSDTPTEPGAERVGIFDTLFPQHKILSEALDKAAYKAGGAVTDVTGSPGAGWATNILTNLIPALFGGEIAKGSSSLLESGARKLMQMSLKPSGVDLQTGKAARAITTMLDEGVLPTAGGMEKLREMGTAQNAKVAELLAKTGGTVSKEAAASRIQDVVTKAEALHPIPQEILPTIEKVYTGFMKNGLIPKEIPVGQAQAVKQEIYRMAKYGELKADLPREAAFKALGRGLKEELEASVPGVKALNMRASELWNALNVSERKALMHLSNDPVSLGFLAHSPEMATLYMVNKSHYFKGLIAKGLYAGKEQIPSTAARAGIAGYEAIQPQE